MRLAPATLLLSAALVASAAAQQSRSPEQRRHPARAETGIMVAMRDGVRLSTDLYFPDAAPEELPVILWRTVYGKRGALESVALLSALVERGYVVATQDTRGRGASEGRFKPSAGDRQDGYDTVSWLTSQPWSNQKVGTAGCSAHGEVQLLLAATRHPHHLAAVPQASASGYAIRGRPWASFDGGAFELAQTAGWFSGDPGRLDYWTLPIVEMLERAGLPPSEYESFASSSPEGAYFRELEWIRPGDLLDVPALFFDSWYDYGPAETLELFEVLRRESPSARARENQFVVIAPGTHCAYDQATEHTVVGERDLGDARFDAVDLQLRWFDYWLKGVDDGIAEMPRVQYYVMGENRWRSSPTWPVPGTRFEKLYLGGGGRANTRLGDGTLSFAPPSSSATDAFVYDPGAPVPSLGGHACCTGTDTESGSYDQSEIELRADVLVYTSAALEDGLEVTGPLTAVLYVSSSARDTDFTAKLVDVYPDGRAFNVQEGALRMRYRKGFDQSLRMRVGEVYEIRLDLHATSNFFGPGHRIRLEVSSSNFPRWDRNLNTGGNNFDESAWVIADNRVHHSPERPSHLLLPIVQRD